MIFRSGLLLLWAILAIPVAAEEFRQELVFDTDATIDTDRLATCIVDGDPRLCIGTEAAACREQPSTAPNAIYAGIRCDLAEMNYWQGLLEQDVARLKTDLRRRALAAFTAGQNLWNQEQASYCSFPYDFIDEPLWPEGEATTCALHHLAERALLVKTWVEDYLDYCEFPKEDLRPGVICKP